MTDANRPNPQSPFVARWIATLGSEFPHGRALDVACGWVAAPPLPLAAAGFHVVVDIQMDVLADARLVALSRGLAVLFACADCPLERAAAARALPRHRRDTLSRPTAVPALRDGPAPDGVLLYETFTEHQLRCTPDSTLAGVSARSRGSCQRTCGGMDVLFDEEVIPRRTVASRRDAGAPRTVALGPAQLLSSTDSAAETLPWATLSVLRIGVKAPHPPSRPGRCRAQRRDIVPCRPRRGQH